jgi:hypothetical protein
MRLHLAFNLLHFLPDLGALLLCISFELFVHLYSEHVRNISDEVRSKEIAGYRFSVLLENVFVVKSLKMSLEKLKKNLEVKRTLQ